MPPSVAALSKTHKVNMKLSDLKVFPINNADRFEDFCLDLYKVNYNDFNIQKNGRRGQRQNGVDIFCHINNPFEWIGIQCKVRNSNESLTFEDVKKEVEKAKLFNPKLSYYIIATTSSRDSNLQELVRELSAKNHEEGYFTIKIDFWEDIQDKLSDEKSNYVLIKYYSDFIIDSLKYGFSVGRLVTILLGIEDDYNTQHELLISKIPLIDENINTGILYFQDRYIVSDLNSRKFSIITNECFPSDFEDTIYSSFDRELIAKWLRNSKIDEIINSDIDFYYCSFTRDEHKDFINEMRTC